MDYPHSDLGSRLTDGRFSDGDPSQGVSPSIDKAAHMNAVYDELINAISAIGETPDEAHVDQLATGLAGHISRLDGLATNRVAGSVGTYAFLNLNRTELVHIQAGDLIPGSELTYSSIGGTSQQVLWGTYGVPLGTWQCMGHIPSSFFFSSSLYVRVL